MVFQGVCTYPPELAERGMERTYALAACPRFARFCVIGQGLRYFRRRMGLLLFLFVYSSPPDFNSRAAFFFQVYRRSDRGSDPSPLLLIRVCRELFVSTHSPGRHVTRLSP